MRRFTTKATTVLAALLALAAVPATAHEAGAQPPSPAPAVATRAGTVPRTASPEHPLTGPTTRPAWSDKGAYVARQPIPQIPADSTPVTSRSDRAHTPAFSTGERVLATPYSAQPNGYYCGPTAVHMALALRRTSPGIPALAAELGTTTIGTGPTPIVTATLKRHTGAPYETTTIPIPASSADTSRLWNNVVADVNGGYALVTWIGAPAHEYSYKDLPYALDHYFVVDGYDTRYRTVRISDPANFDGHSQYWITVDRLAYLIAGTPGYAW